jgi:mRNA interferase RelE/StbE
MSYKLKWSKLALENLRKLPHNIVQRILNKLDEIKENPAHFIKGLTEIKYNKIRIGDYRILVDLLENEKIIAVRDLGHRKKFTRNTKQAK